ncbi:MFS transporter [Paenibacillus sp. S-38]|uniref:MFS transporter n=1 Tax=Paenibacillus sp. S-38 TaxID=3416710 RepID=UPI003CF30298
MKMTYNLGILFALRFFSSLIPAYVIERLYWQERGMTIGMVVYTEIIYAVTIILLEVPTGIAADRWGRKPMLVLGALLGCAEFLLLLYASSFWHFALVVFLAGISRSACSGAENAMLFDTLMQQGRASAFERQLGLLNVFDLSGAILAALSGSWLAGHYDLELNYWLSLGSAAAALLLTLLLVEPHAAHSGEAPMPFSHYVRASLRFFRSRRSLVPVLLSGMMAGSAVGFIDEFWQLYVNGIGLPVVAFGAVSAALMLLRLPGSLLAPWLVGRVGYRVLLVSVTVVCAAGFGTAAVSRDSAGLAALLAVCLFSGMMEPLVTGYLHHRADSSMRATIDSFQSLGLNAVHILTGLGFGALASRTDVFGGYGFVALVCTAFLLWFLAASRRIEEDGGHQAG